MYSTIEDLKARIGVETLTDLTDLEGVGEINETVAEGSIADADGIIDAYCAQAGKATPLSPVPALITGFSADMATHLLYSRKGLAVESRANAYNDAVKFLRDVAAGKATLGTAAEAAAAGDGGIATTKSASERAYRDEVMDAFMGELT